MDNLLDDPVKAAYAAFPAPQRALADMLRDLVLEVARETPGVGEIVETLKWGQPTFQTVRPKSGTPLRIGMTKDGGVGLYVHCTTTVIRDYAATFPDSDRIDGNRGVLFKTKDDIAPDRLRLLIRHALTYHLSSAR